MDSAAVLTFLAILVLAELTVFPAAKNGGGVEARWVVHQARQGVEPAVQNDGRYNASSVLGRKDGGGGGGGGGGSSSGSSWGYGWGWGWGWGTEGGGGGGGGGGEGGSSTTTTRTEWHGDSSGAVRRRRARRHHHRPSYSSSLYRVGEYARCTASGRCRGMRLLCPMHCEGPCFYDCDANCKAHCRFY